MENIIQIFKNFSFEIEIEMNLRSASSMSPLP